MKFTDLAIKLLDFLLEKALNKKNCLANENFQSFFLFVRFIVNNFLFE